MGPNREILMKTWQPLADVLLKAEVSKTPKGISIDGTDPQGTWVHLWITQETPHAQVCEIDLLDPQSRQFRGRARLVDENIVPQQAPDTGITVVQGLNGDTLTVGPNIPAAIRHALVNP